MKNSGKLISFLVPIISILLAFVIGCAITQLEWVDMPNNSERPVYGTLCSCCINAGGSSTLQYAVRLPNCWKTSAPATR